MQIVLNTHFNNLEQFIDEVQHWDFDFRLLGTGGFLGHVKQFISRDVLISYARFHRGLDQAGATPPGYRTFVILGKGCKGFWWRGHQVTNNDLLIFPQSGELRCASNADFEIITISVREPYLEQLGEDLGLVGLAKSTHEVIRLDSRTAQTLRALAGACGYDCKVCGRDGSSYCRTGTVRETRYLHSRRTSKKQTLFT